ncbi:hypothetical protein [Olsenella sp. Marseille-P4559]|uniref:hypothetical protein n=1 Tax=Olsenella sp. Marseille-P4559 TaxID=2364795 RepID=UPI0010308DCA|nr:hypothetical protein [Olsenella sp. Marseille-P4559]
MSGYLAGGKAARKARAEVDEVVEKALASEAVHTATPGRGKEFSDAGVLQEGLGAPVCLCDPHHPWEREANENADGFSGTGSRRAWASTTSQTTRCKGHTIRSTGDRASA